MAVLPNDMLSPTFLLGAINTRPDRNAIRQNYIGEQLFSRRDVPERRLMWDSLVAENNLAGFYSPKGSAVPGSDLPFATHFADLIDLKASRYLDADLLQKVRDPGMPAIIKAAGDSFTVKAIQSRVAQHMSDNLAWCDDAIDAQLEYMAIGAITGSIVWPPRDANNAAIQFPMPHWNPEMTLTVNMGLDSNFNQNVTTLTGYGGRTGSGVAWNANGADPVLDLEIISEFMTEQVGVNSYGAKLVMSRATLSRIAFLPNVLRWLTGAVTVSGTSATAVNAFPAAGYADIETIKNFVSTKLGYDIVLYDAQWTYRTLNTSTGVETVNRVKFLKEGRVIILPKGFNVGYMAYAPHETQAGNWVTGKAPWVWQSDKPPIMRELGVNCVAFPIITYPSEIFNLNVYA
jgi:hypothetical protein